jgi:Flp pilus assembly protein TadD
LFDLCVCVFTFSRSKSQSTKPSQAQPGNNSNQTNAGLSEAASLFQAGRIREAEATARNVITINPKSSEAHALLGAILDKTGKRPKQNSNITRHLN